MFSFLQIAALLALREAAATGDGKTYRYRKAAVTLSEIRLAGTEQRSLLSVGAVRCEDDRVRQIALMEALDAANRKWGKRAVVVASQGCPATLARTRAESGAPGWESGVSG